MGSRGCRQKHIGNVRCLEGFKQRIQNSMREQIAAGRDQNFMTALFLYQLRESANRARTLQQLRYAPGQAVHADFHSVLIDSAKCLIHMLSMCSPIVGKCPNGQTILSSGRVPENSQVNDTLIIRRRVSAAQAPKREKREKDRLVIFSREIFRGCSIHYHAGGVIWQSIL